jgi:ABC-type amino acid transport substrate-binding protein
MLTRTNDSMINRVRELGEMRVAVALNKPPEEGLNDEFYLDPKTGQPAGVVIDYMKMMANDLGVRPVWVSIPWKDQVDALLADEIDILPKHTNTPERALYVDFADQMISFEVLIMTAKDREENFQSLKEKGKIIACSRGSSNRLVIEKEFPQAVILEVDEYLLGAEAVDNKNANAWVESAISKTLLEVKPNLKIVRNSQGEKIVLSRDYAHMAVKLGDQRSINWINNWIKFRMAQGDLKQLIDVRWPACLAE